MSLVIYLTVPRISQRGRVEEGRESPECGVCCLWGLRTWTSPSTSWLPLGSCLHPCQCLLNAHHAGGGPGALLSSVGSERFMFLENSIQFHKLSSEQKCMVQILPSPDALCPFICQVGRQVAFAIRELGSEPAQWYLSLIHI